MTILYSLTHPLVNGFRFPSSWLVLAVKRFVPPSRNNYQALQLFFIKEKMNQERIEQVLEDNRNVLEEVYVPRAPLRFRQRFMVEMAIGDGVGPWSILSRQITNEVNLVIQLPRRPTLPPGTELVPTWAKRTSSVLFECPPVLCWGDDVYLRVRGGCIRRVACTECTFRMVGIEIWDPCPLCRFSGEAERDEPVPEIENNPPRPSLGRGAGLYETMQEYYDPPQALHPLGSVRLGRARARRGAGLGRSRGAERRNWSIQRPFSGPPSTQRPFSVPPNS